MPFQKNVLFTFHRYQAITTGAKSAMKKRALYSVMAGFAIVALLGASMVGRVAGQASGGTVNVGKGEIGGTVTSAKGPEAGVWVIAETADLPTRYMKEVVTDDRGRYLIPDLPQANYTVWARGYGLLDSAKVKTEPGKLVDLKPTVAPDAKSAAHYYPAIYWYSLVSVPKANEFPGTGAQGNGILPAVKSQAQWVEGMKTDGCEACHQLGNEYTRT